MEEISSRKYKVNKETTTHNPSLSRGFTFLENLSETKKSNNKLGKIGRQHVPFA